MSIYYNYAPDGTKIVVLPYVDNCVYCYTSEALRKWFVENLGKVFHVNFLGCAHWFMSRRIYQMKDHSISVDQAIYATSIVAQYLDTDTVKASNCFIRPILHMIRYSPKMMHLPVMSKLRSLLGNSIFTTEFVLDH